MHLFDLCIALINVGSITVRWTFLILKLRSWSNRWWNADSLKVTLCECYKRFSLGQMILVNQKRFDVMNRHLQIFQKFNTTFFKQTWFCFFVNDEIFRSLVFQQQCKYAMIWIILRKSFVNVCNVRFNLTWNFSARKIVLLSNDKNLLI